MNHLISRGFVRGKFPTSDLSDHAAVKPHFPPHMADTLLRPDEGTAVRIGPSVHGSLDRSSIARQQGYTGSTCTNCQSSRMKVSGHCEVCEECGTTTGCS